MENIIIRNLSFSYHSSEGTYPVFNNLNAAFNGPGLISLLGESGSGKSTLLFMLGGYLAPDAGKIYFSEKKENIGYVFQELHLISHLCVEDNVALPLILDGYKKEETEEKVKNILRVCGIYDLAEKMPDEISGGQRARVALARALIRGNDVLLLDEPTGSLDEKTAAGVMKLLKELGKRYLVLLVTHNERLACLYSDQIYLLKDSRIISLRQRLKKDPLNRKGSVIGSSIRVKENLCLSFSFLRKRLFKIVFSLFSVGICFGILINLCAVLNNIGNEISRLSSDCFSYTALTLTERKEYKIRGKDLSLFKTIETTASTEERIKKAYPDISFYDSLDYFIAPTNEVKKEDRYLDDPLFFSPSFPDSSRLKEGEIPSSYDECVISPSLFSKGIKIGDVLSVKEETIVTSKFEDRKIKDLYSEVISFKVKGVAKEKDILSRPSLYYDYRLVLNHLSSLFLKEYSSALGKKISIKDRLVSYTDEDDKITCFKTIGHVEDAYGFYKFMKKEFPDVNVSSVPLTLASSLSLMADSFGKILYIFLGVSSLCSFFLMSIVLYSLYREKEKEFALYFSFHISLKEFYRLGSATAFIVGLILGFLGLLMALLFIPFSNHALCSYGFNSFINFGVIFPYLLFIPLFSQLFSYLICFLLLKRYSDRSLVFKLQGAE